MIQQGGIRRCFVCLIVTMAAATGMVVGTACAADEEYTALHYWPKDKFFADTICFYWKGEYHVFHLSTRCSWAHLVSTDLVHWRELPDALERGTEPKGPDSSACWTGSIVERDGTFYCFYTGLGLEDPKGQQKVMIATSTDLVKWTKHPELRFYADGKYYWNATINGPFPESVHPAHKDAFRDPEVFWNPESNKWAMVLHACAAGTGQGAFAHYESDDLLHWEVRPPLNIPGGDCPYVFREKDKWYLLQGSFCSMADRLEGPYSPGQPFDVGLFAVPKGMYDGKRRIMAAWINTLKDEAEPQRNLTDSGYAAGPGIMGLPHEVYVADNGDLCERAPKEILEYFNRTVLDLSAKPTPVSVYNKWKYDEAGTLVSRESFHDHSVARFEAPADYLLHCRVTFRDPRAQFAIRFREDPGLPESGYWLRINPETRRVELGGRYHSYPRTCAIDFGKPVDIKLFVLGSVVECFVNDAYGFTMRAYDFRKGTVALDVVNTHEPVQVQALTLKTHGE